MNKLEKFPSPFGVLSFQMRIFRFFKRRDLVSVPFRGLIFPNPHLHTPPPKPSQTNLCVGNLISIETPPSKPAKRPKNPPFSTCVAKPHPNHPYNIIQPHLLSFKPNHIALVLATFYENQPGAGIGTPWRRLWKNV